MNNDNYVLASYLFGVAGLWFVFGYLVGYNRGVDSTIEKYRIGKP